MSEQVTAGDRYDIPFSVNNDLQGATTVLRVKRAGSAMVTLPHSITDDVNGAGIITDTSSLPVGEYSVELEATKGTQIITYKAKEPLVIGPQLG